MRAGIGPAPLGAHDVAGWVCFPDELQPHAAHPLVRAMGEGARRDLSRRALARYLHAVSVLEIRVVNVVLAEIAHGEMGAELPARERLAALQLTCDEGYHAVVASDLLAQLGDVGPLPAPAFVARLEALCDRHANGASDAAFLRFLFTVVTETAISANMRQLARSAAVLPAVRDFVADHARDEAFHGAYFTGLFATFWQRLSAAERARRGALLPDLVTAYLSPDTGAIGADLRGAGLSPGEVEIVVAETYGAAAQRASVRQAAGPVLSCFRRGGALSGETRDRFVSAGLLEGAV